MKKTIKDYQYEGKRVIVRCDFNVPIENGKITDDTRILESLKTINYLIEKDAKIILLSHLGKIKTKEDMEKNTLYPVYLRLKELLSTNIYFCDQTRGKKLEEMVSNLKNREIILIENTRYEDYPDRLESNCDKQLSKYWASLGDIFINDAYGTSHRKHASNVGIASIIPNAIGFLIEKEVIALNGIIEENTHPFVILMGGKKISDKTLVIDNLIQKCDKILLGGGMCFTFLKAKNINVGSSIVDDENISYCKELLEQYHQKIVLPVDIVLKNKQIKNINSLSTDDIGCDIGPETIKIFEKELVLAKRVIVNGPMGIFEEPPFAKGTSEIFKTLKENNIKTLVGGGDSVASINLLGYNNSFYHISTGGGATLEYLSGKPMPGIEIIDEKE